MPNSVMQVAEYSYCPHSETSQLNLTVTVNWKSDVKLNLGECYFLRTSDLNIINRAQQNFSGSGKSQVINEYSYLSMRDKDTNLLLFSSYTPPQ